MIPSWLGLYMKREVAVAEKSMTGVVARAQSIKPGTVHALYEMVRSERGVRSADAQTSGGIDVGRAGLPCELLGVMRSSDNHEFFICNNSE